MIKLSVKDQIELYDMLNAHHTITSKGVDSLTYSDIIDIVSFLRNKDYI